MTCHHHIAILLQMKSFKGRRVKERRRQKAVYWFPVSWMALGTAFSTLSGRASCRAWGTML